MVEAQVWPPMSSKTARKHDLALGNGDTPAVPEPPRAEAILLDLRGAAAAFSISRRLFQVLRKRADFPENATVVLGPRCVRFRVQALQQFALSMASSPQSSPRQAPRSDRRERSGGARFAATRPECDKPTGSTGERPGRIRE